MANPTDKHTNQEFRVVCVTKRGKNREDWHLPITGKVSVTNFSYEELGVKICTATFVRFWVNGGRTVEGFLKNVEKGLGQTSVVISFVPRNFHTSDGVDKDSPETWDLYTDTPTEGHTVEEVRAEADNMLRAKALLVKPKG